jgi:hypothetical protein
MNIESTDHTEGTFDGWIPEIYFKLETVFIGSAVSAAVGC